SNRSSVRGDEMAQKDSHYVPAFGIHWLTPFYDSFAKPFADSFRRRLIQQANIQPGQRVLDLGCGTGLLTIMLKRSIPDARVTGLDGDEEVLNIARDKSRGTDIQWDHAFATDLPYPDQSFDAVVSSFVTHHLTSADKARTFQEVRRVLRPDGGFHIVDFGPPFNILTRAQASVMKNLERTVDNFAGRILPMLTEAGFGEVKEAGHVITFFGPVAFYRAVKGA
ncbi:MAG: methyltransferase domain-containing protein, partial [Anaerolineales bacterium]|nr:methyltransferase domain-containing protein [Anaerolineales bacterium]